MRPATFRSLQALILGTTGLFFLYKIWSGSLYWYINERFLVLVLFAAIALLVLAQMLIAARYRRLSDDNHIHTDVLQVESGHVHDHPPRGKFPWGLILLALPVLLGILIPARPLGASAVANKGLLTTPPISSRPVASQLLLEVPANNRTILDWLKLIYDLEDPQSLVGESVDVVGFVYRPLDLEDGQFMVGRFTMTCCVADAFAIGMLVNWPQAQDLPENSWVRVQGSLDIARRPTDDRELLAVIHAQKITPVGEPTQPYLYP